jgi:septal ring factor EnvC (AmiA/AmiB activator)
MDMVGGIVGEIKRSPYTSLAAMLSFVFCTVAGPTLYSAKADAADVQKLERQIAEVRDTVRRESAQGEINNVQRELFDITLRINTLERENINVDPLLYKRKDDLMAQQRRLEAKLQAMEAQQ